MTTAPAPDPGHPKQTRYTLRPATAVYSSPFLLPTTMRISRNHAALLLILLVQLGMALAGNVSQRTLLVGHSAACDGHGPENGAGEHEHGVASAPAHDSHPCAAAVADEPAGAFDCCPCPHVHFRLLDGPLVRSDTSGVKVALPKVGAPIRLSGTEAASALPEPLGFAALSRRLASNRPPPTGWASTILII